MAGQNNIQCFIRFNVNAWLCIMQTCFLDVFLAVHQCMSFGNSDLRVCFMQCQRKTHLIQNCHWDIGLWGCINWLMAWLMAIFLALYYRFNTYCVFTTVPVKQSHDTKISPCRFSLCGRNTPPLRREQELWRLWSGSCTSLHLLCSWSKCWFAGAVLLKWLVLSLESAIASTDPSYTGSFLHNRPKPILFGQREAKTFCWIHHSLFIVKKCLWPPTHRALLNCIWDTSENKRHPYSGFAQGEEYIFHMPFGKDLNETGLKHSPPCKGTCGALFMCKYSGF